MLQRIQTIYLFLAVVLSCVGFFLPLGTFMSGDEQTGTMYNLWVADAAGEHNLITSLLLVVLLLSVIIGGYTIFCFTNRKFQSKLCMFNILLMFCWYIVFATMTQVVVPAGSEFIFGIGSIPPSVSLILYILARRAIKADEELVRAADRIR